MLNRRILRVKALQALYSYYTTKNSLQRVMSKKLADKYELDPAIHDFSDKQFFEKRQQLLEQLFEDKLREKSTGESGLKEEELMSVDNAYQEYLDELSSERKKIRKQMLSEVDDIKKTYLKILLLPAEFAFIESQDKEKIEKKAGTNQSEWNHNLLRNPLIDKLTSFEQLQQNAIKLKVDWKNETEELNNWYKTILKNDARIIEYQSKKDPSLEEHKEILLYILKKLVFKNDTIEAFMIDRDLYWQENKATLRSLVTKTIKTFDIEAPEAFQLLELSKNMEEDIEFFQVVFDETIKKNKEMDQTIAKRTKNWDLTRVAAIDRIILKMALTEMITFPSIPVKVTINEYIEISKIYSTPKSKQFINGILDVISNELTSEGVIRKSGRGLIDNK